MKTKLKNPKNGYSMEMSFENPKIDIGIDITITKSMLLNVVMFNLFDMLFPKEYKLEVSVDNISTHIKINIKT